MSLNRLFEEVLQESRKQHLLEAKRVHIITGEILCFDGDGEVEGKSYSEAIEEIQEGYSYDSIYIQMDTLKVGENCMVDNYTNRYYGDKNSIGVFIPSDEDIGVYDKNNLPIKKGQLKTVKVKVHPNEDQPSIEILAIKA
jgi:hypothetical protein